MNYCVVLKHHSRIRLFIELFVAEFLIEFLLPAVPGLHNIEDEHVLEQQNGV